jgi:hypothetical protein
MSGITVLTDKLFTNWNYELRTLKNKVKELFIEYFKKQVEFEEETI